MIQERINQLNKEAELAEAQLIKNLKNVAPLKIVGSMASSLGSSALPLTKLSNSSLGSVITLLLSGSALLFPFSKKLLAINKIISALK